MIQQRHDRHPSAQPQRYPAHQRRHNAAGRADRRLQQSRAMAAPNGCKQRQQNRKQRLHHLGHPGYRLLCLAQVKLHIGGNRRSQRQKARALCDPDYVLSLASQQSCRACQQRRSKQPHHPGKAAARIAQQAPQQGIQHLPRVPYHLALGQPQQIHPQVVLTRSRFKRR